MHTQSYSVTKSKKKTKKKICVCRFYEDLNLKLYDSANRIMALCLNSAIETMLFVC